MSLIKNSGWPACFYKAADADFANFSFDISLFVRRLKSSIDRRVHHYVGFMGNTS